MKKIILLAALTSVFVFTCHAQKSGINYDQKVMRLSTPADGAANYSFRYLFYNWQSVYTYKNYVCAEGQNITDMAFNPSGSSIAYIDNLKKKTTVNVGFISGGKLDIKSITFKEDLPVSVSYTSDSRQMSVALTSGKIIYYDSKTLAPSGDYLESFPAKKMIYSGNGYYLAANDDYNVNVRECEGKQIRVSLIFKEKVVSTAFSADNEMFAVLTEDGACHIYDTKHFAAKTVYSTYPDAKAVYFHPGNKYIAIATGADKITFINMVNEAEKHELILKEAGLMSMTFLPSLFNENTTILSYNTSSALVMGLLSGLTEYRTSLIKDELQMKMNQWMMQMPGESLEEYETRVNESTIQNQMQAFKLEIATSMAGDILANETISFGNYNMETGLLLIDFSTLPSILIPVGETQLQYFSDPSKLVFENVQYDINGLDEFEMVYAEVRNTDSGEIFIFDNRSGHLLQFMTETDGAITLEQLKATKMEEMKLEEIKNAILETATKESILSEHTKIDVSTRVNNTHDANGNAILNYDIDVAYTVDEEYSTRDDFPAGKYKVENSNAAKAMVQVVIQAFEGEFSKYLVAGKKLEITIKGTADASPVRGKIAYDGCYGEYEYEPIYQDGTLNNITVTKTSGITTNEQLAFLRALGVKDHLVKNMPALSTMKTTFKPSISVAKEFGSEYRRIGVSFSFIDAL